MPYNNTTMSLPIKTICGQALFHMRKPSKIYDFIDFNEWWARDSLFTF